MSNVPKQHKTGLLAAILCVATVTGLASPTMGETLTYSQSFKPRKPGWSSTFRAPQFDPTLGTLESVVISLTGRTEGVAAFENLGESPADVQIRYTAEFQLVQDSSPILVASPTLELSDVVSAFDGVLNYTGDSGRTYKDIAADATSDTTFILGRDDLTSYIGTGLLSIRLLTGGFIGQPQSSGALNASDDLELYINQRLSATVDLTYEYTAVPEPGLATLVGLGGGVLLRRRRRAMKAS